MTKVLRITAKKDGFRRAGVAHSAGPVDHPLDRFNADQIKALKAEPMLVVEETEAAKPADPAKVDNDPAKVEDGKSKKGEAKK